MIEQGISTQHLFEIPERYKDNPDLYDSSLEPVNISSSSGEVIGLLSNFPNTPFDLDNQHYESVEGFIQSLKEEDDEKQDQIGQLVGGKAKRAGKKKADAIKESYAYDSDDDDEPVGYVTTYQDIQIPYKSAEHYDLIARAIRAKFEQNENCKNALLSTGNAKLIHVLTNHDGSEQKENPLTSLPAEIFTSILMQTRKELEKEI